MCHSQHKTIPCPDALETTLDKSRVLGLRGLGACHWLRMSTHISPSEGIIMSSCLEETFLTLSLGSRRHILLFSLQAS